MISDENLNLKINKMSDYMLNVFNDVKENKIEIDNKTNNMIILIGVMISIHAGLIFTMELKLNMIFMTISLLFYFISLLLFVKSYDFKTFRFAPTSNQLIEYGKDNNLFAEQMIVHVNSDLNDSINHNLKVLNRKSEMINKGFNFLILGILFTMISILIYLIF
jgi:hypothetical protein